MSLLKDIYTPQFLTEFATQVQSYQADFDGESFVADVLNDNWEELTVRQRMKKIATLLGVYLSGTYSEQLPIILKLHEKNRGFNFLFLPDFVSIYGLNETDFDLSLDYLKQLTPYSSAEFPIREFILLDEQKALPFLMESSLDENEHVRRLASEGTRPRLPWSFQLTNFKNNPDICLPILTNLKNDSSLYVRKSVANHLNDISKDFPDFVVATSQEWLGESAETDWIIKRACRSLVKNAYPPALDLFGFKAPGSSFDITKATIKVGKPSVEMGQETTFSYMIDTTISNETPIRLEYGIDYIKANGKASLKKFHLFDGFVTKNKLTGKKKLSFKPLSTRTYYTGNHRLILFCNGQEIAETHFLLE